MCRVEFLDIGAHTFGFGLGLTHVDIERALARSAQHWSSYSGYLREIRKYNGPLQLSNRFMISYI